MSKRPETVVALEIRPSEARMAELARNGRRVLATSRLPLAPGRWLDPDHLSATVRTLLDATSGGKSARLAVSLPSGVAHLRRVLAPAGPAAREHLAWDLETWLGEPLDAYVWDHASLTSGTTRKAARAGSDGDAEAGTPHLVACAPRETARLVRDAVARAAGRPPALLEVDAAVLPRLLPVNYPEHPGAALLVHAHADATTVVDVRAGVPVALRVLRDAAEAFAPGSGPQERAEGLLRLARVLGRIAADTAAEAAGSTADGSEAAPVLVGGTLAVDADFRELLRAHVPTAALLNPFRHLAGPDPATHPEAYPGAPLAAAVALALRADAEDDA